MPQLMNILWTAGFMAMVLTACRDNLWDPDKQFAEQRGVQEEAILKAQIEPLVRLKFYFFRIAECL
jgi:hypothetical protein